MATKPAAPQVPTTFTKGAQKTQISPGPVAAPKKVLAKRPGR